MAIRHPYNLGSDQPNKSSTHLTWYTVFTILLTVLYTPMTILITGNLYFLNPVQQHIVLSVQGSGFSKLMHLYLTHVLKHSTRYSSWVGLACFVHFCAHHALLRACCYICECQNSSKKANIPSWNLGPSLMGPQPDPQWHFQQGNT